MARPWRIEYAGAFYQVVSSGNGNQRIFLKTSDIDEFMSLLSLFSTRFTIDILAYLFMPGYYKLLIKTHHGNLSKAMQWLGATYTRRYNIRHQTRGHLFQGRYKSVVVENEKYITRLSCDLHCDPVRAKLVKQPIQYPYSSYGGYAHKDHVAPSWLNKDLLLSRSKSKDYYRAYRRKVQYHLVKGYCYQGKDFRHGFIFGSAAFVKQIKNRFAPPQPNPEITQQRRLHGHEPHQLASKMARILKCDLNQFKNTLRIPASQKNTRNMIIYFLWNSGFFSNRQIGDIFGLSYSMVSRAVSDYRTQITHNDGLQNRIARIEAQLGS